jgi:hypothetical protein
VAANAKTSAVSTHMTRRDVSSFDCQVNPDEQSQIDELTDSKIQILLTGPDQTGHAARSPRLIFLPFCHYKYVLATDSSASPQASES